MLWIRGKTVEELPEGLWKDLLWRIKGSLRIFFFFKKKNQSISILLAMLGFIKTFFSSCVELVTVFRR
jgi:hypothetical protein